MTLEISEFSDDDIRAEYERRVCLGRRKNSVFLKVSDALIAEVDSRFTSSEADLLPCMGCGMAVYFAIHIGGGIDDENYICFDCLDYIETDVCGVRPRELEGDVSHE